MLATTWACVEGNKRLLLATRHLLEVSRRVLDHPSLRIAGGSYGKDGHPGKPHDPVLREKVLQALAQKRIPTREPEVLHGATGVGRMCSVCESTVTADETDIELRFNRDRAGGDVYHVHVRCYSAWARTLWDGLPLPHWARPVSHPRSLSR